MSHWRFWWSESVTVCIEALCVLTGHWRGCWVMNRAPLLARAYAWAADVFYAQIDYAGRHDCPYCGKDRPRPSSGDQWVVRDASELPQTGNLGTPMTLRVERAGRNTGRTT